MKEGKEMSEVYTNGEFQLFYESLPIGSVEREIADKTPQGEIRNIYLTSLMNHKKNEKREIEENEKKPMIDFSDNVLVAPNTILQYNFFPISPQEFNRISVNEPIIIDSNKNIVIKNTRGLPVSLIDEEIFLYVCRAFRTVYAGIPVEIRPRDVLLWMGKSDGKENRKTVLKSIKAVASNIYEITRTFKNGAKREYFGPFIVLLTDIDAEGSVEKVSVNITSACIRLFLEDNITYIPENIYRSLNGTGSHLAKKLMTILRTYKEPFPMYLSTIKEKCGSKMLLRDFKKLFKKAMEKLIEKREIFKYIIKKGQEGDKVYIFRTEKSYKEYLENI
jgi:hypothetical protein